MWGGFTRRVTSLLLAGLLGAILVRIAPGFGTDEREMDARLSPASVEQIRQAASGDRNVLSFYGGYLLKVMKGDLGYSRLLDRPVRALLADRLPVTLRSAGAGWVGGVIAGFIAALVAIAASGSALEITFAGLGGAMLCVPAGLLALMLYFAGLPVAAGIGAVIFPKVFFYAQSVLKDSREMPHVLAARASGERQIRVLLWHVLLPCGRTLLALLGVTLTAALGASIPMEVVCDSPGIGQLAWRAALGRDLPLLTGLTLFVALVTLAANSLADLASARLEATE